MTQVILQEANPPMVPKMVAMPAQKESSNLKESASRAPLESIKMRRVKLTVSLVRIRLRGPMTIRQNASSAQKEGTNPKYHRWDGPVQSVPLENIKIRWAKLLVCLVRDPQLTVSKELPNANNARMDINPIRNGVDVKLVWAHIRRKIII